MFEIVFEFLASLIGSLSWGGKKKDDSFGSRLFFTLLFLFLFAVFIGCLMLVAER